MADSKITGLIQDTSPSLTDLIPTVKDPGGTPLSRKVTLGDAFKLMQGNIVYLVNNDGVAHYAGTVVIFDTSIDNGCKKTTTSGDPKVCGIAAETVSAGATGKYYQVGQATVLVQGNVSRGAWVIASTTSGRAEQYGYLKPSSGGIGIALTSYAGGGAGTVTVMIAVQLTSTASLQKLATTSTGVINGNTTLTISHTTDAGTDLLVVLVGTTNSGSMTSITFNGVGLTQHYSNVYSATGYHGVHAYYLKTPAIGTYNIVITFSASARIYGCALNFAGSVATPLRTQSTYQSASTTSGSVTPASAVGDIVLDVSALSYITAGWSAGASQNVLAQNYTQADQYLMTWKAGAAGTTTMSQSGAASIMNYAAFAVAGS